MKGERLTSPVLTEVEAAYYAGFKRWAHFLIARNKDLFPKPVRDLPGVGPMWTQRQIDQWLGLAEAPGSKSAREIEQEAMINAARNRKKTALR